MPTENNHSAKNTAQALWKVTKVVLDTLEFNQVTQKICDSLLSELGYLNLGYRIIVLSLFDEKTQGLQRISLSQTDEAKAAMDASSIPFHDISVPLSAIDNYCVKAFLEQKPQSTQDWKDILSPPLLPEDARINQKAAGIHTSMVFPVIVRGKSVGTVIFSIVKEITGVTPEEYDLINGFTEIIGIAVQNAKLYSDLEKTSKHLDEANKKLEVLDKLKDEFVSVASHELRTPMTAIKSYTWLVLNGKSGEINPKTREYLDRVYQSTDRLIHLVNEMLDVSRIEGGRVTLKMEPLDLVKLATDVQNEFSARSAESALTLNITPFTNLPPVTADREKIHQVLENLIGNAYKFTPRGGTVTVSFKVNNDLVETSVTDTGQGIAPDDLPQLFKKFGRLENSLISLANNSTGLGLYICKQYVELHHGQIWIDSKLGKGSTFTFSLPIDTLIANPPRLS